MQKLDKIIQFFFLFCCKIYHAKKIIHLTTKSKHYYKNNMAAKRENCRNIDIVRNYKAFVGFHYSGKENMTNTT